MIYEKILPGIREASRICLDRSGNGFLIVGDRSYYGTGAVVAINNDGAVRWAIGAESLHEESPWAVVTDSNGSILRFP